jgi:hypothetical protein
MERFFNTAGVVRKDLHYCIEPLSRINLNEILALIRQQKYFVLHAPRQTGKTSYLYALMDYINNEGTYKCLYINIENAQAAREKVKEGMRIILRILAENAVDYLEDSFFNDRWEEIFKNTSEFTVLQKALKLWSKHNSKEIVLFIDEADSLIGDTMISLLRQLRSGYDMRPALFPRSIILCGVRDVRDYRIHSDIEKTAATGGSVFNIKAASLRLGNFSSDQIKLLYQQHTEETGQPFNRDIFPLVWELTEGQPWLVNALAYETCFELKEGRDRRREITVEMINQSKENLIMRRETHLHQLTDKLGEKRVRRVIAPILSGLKKPVKIPEDDVDYVSDLGLIKKRPQLMMANRIYREIVSQAINLQYPVDHLPGTPVLYG